MTQEERLLIKELDKCDFGEIHAMHKAKVEARRNMTKEEKLVGGRAFFSVHEWTTLGFSHLSVSVQRRLVYIIQVMDNIFLNFFFKN